MDEGHSCGAPPRSSSPMSDSTQENNVGLRTPPKARRFPAGRKGARYATGSPGAGHAVAPSERMAAAVAANMESTRAMTFDALPEEDDDVLMLSPEPLNADVTPGEAPPARAATPIRTPVFAPVYELNEPSEHATPSSTSSAVGSGAERFFSAGSSEGMSTAGSTPGSALAPAQSTPGSTPGSALRPGTLEPPLSTPGLAHGSGAPEPPPRRSRTPLSHSSSTDHIASPPQLRGNGTPQDMHDAAMSCDAQGIIDSRRPDRVISASPISEANFARESPVASTIPAHTAAATPTASLAGSGHVNGPRAAAT